VIMNPDIKITNLIENHTDNPKLIAEHGLSLYIEVNDFSCLVDSGQSGAFIDNAKALNIDIEKQKYIFVSHNHYDHAGGLERLLEINPDIKIIASVNCKEPSLKVLSDEDALKIQGIDGAEISELDFPPKDIGGLDKLYNEKPESFIFIADDEVYTLAENIYILKPQKSEKEFVCKDTALASCMDDRIVRDEFEHELFMVIERDDDIVIISSCSHSGIVNIAKTAYERFQKPISNIVGGFHLRGKDGDNSLNCDEEFIKATCERLKEFGVEKIYTGHCTGLVALDILKKYLGDKATHFKTGAMLEI